MLEDYVCQAFHTPLFRLGFDSVSSGGFHGVTCSSLKKHMSPLKTFYCILTHIIVSHFDQKKIDNFNICIRNIVDFKGIEFHIV